MEKQWVVVGRISGRYGVRGWVKVTSFTEPRENILNYQPWQLQQGGEVRECVVAEGRIHGKGLIARLDGVDDRDDAAGYVGADIRVERKQFGRESKGEYYWVDLEGMRVETVDGIKLGTVASMLATGANDVMVLEGERRRLVPFLIDDVVKRIDRSSGTIVVDWDPDY